MTRGRSRLALVAAGLLLGAAGACAPARVHVALPEGPGEPAPPAADAIAAEVFGRCASLHTLTAEIGLSGRAGREKLRGRLIAGFARGSVRLEAVAPFGPPVFILAASPSQATLLLPRDHRVLRDSTPSAILDALAGISLAPDDLLARLGGCPSLTPSFETPRAYGGDWLAFTTGDRTAWVRRAGGAATWRLAVLVEPALRTDFEYADDGTLARVAMRSMGGAAAARVDLTLALSQVEVNAPVPGEAFTVTVPEGTDPITLEELRASGPMRDATAPESR